MSHWFLPRLTATASPAQSPGSVRRLSTDVLHIFVLTSFAIAQPVYDRISRRISFLMDQSVTPSAVRLLVFLLSCVLPTLIALVAIATAHRRRQLYESFHSIFVFVCLLLSVLPVCSQMVFLPGFLMLAAALAAAGFGVCCYFRFRWAQMLVTWSSPGILLFPGLLLFQYSAATSVIGAPATRSAHWDPVPVVLLVFDEFCGSTLMTPEREIDTERFPNFAALSRQSTWFRNASSVSPDTVQAIPAILSGRYPTLSEAPGPADFPHNLFKVLAATGGYEIAAFEPVSNLGKWGRTSKRHKPSSVCQQTLFLLDIFSRLYLYQITPQVYHTRLPSIPLTWFGWHDFTDADRTQKRGVFEYAWNDQRELQFQHFLKCLDGAPRPAFYFGHFLLPHVPWSYLPSGRCYSEDVQNSDLMCLGLDGERPVDDLAAIQNQQRYLLQLMYVDRLVGRLLSRLSETGMLDRCLLIVTADHGVSFRAQQPRRSLAPGNQDEILSIPLFIKRPHQTSGEISDRAVESVDILPTVADVIGMTLQAPMDGWSVFDDSHPARTQLTVRDQQMLRHVDPSVITESQVPAVLRKRFGSGSDRDALFQNGPYPELIGRTVESVQQTTDSPVEISLLRFADEVHDDSEEAIVPCFFEGLVLSSRPTDKPVVLAIAINGTIRTVARSYRSSEDFQNRWGAMVPEWSLHAGKNDVQFFSVNATEKTLTPCVVENP